MHLNIIMILLTQILWYCYLHPRQLIRCPYTYILRLLCRAGHTSTQDAISAWRSCSESLDDVAEHSTGRCMVQPRCSRSRSILLLFGAWVSGKGGGIWDGRPLVPGQTINKLPIPPPKWQLQSASFEKQIARTFV